MVRPVADRRGHDRRYSLDDSLLRSMGYRPDVSLATGLAATVQWYREIRPWWEPRKRAAAGAVPGQTSRPRPVVPEIPAPHSLPREPAGTSGVTSSTSAGPTPYFLTPPPAPSPPAACPAPSTGSPSPRSWPPAPPARPSSMNPPPPPSAGKPPSGKATVASP